MSTLRCAYVYDTSSLTYTVCDYIFISQALDQSSDQRVHVNLLYTVFGLTKLENGPRERPEWVSILREVSY